MEQIALGKQGLQVSQLGFGCMGLTTAYGNKLPDEEIITLLEKTTQHGITLWDTANLYVFFDWWRVFRLASPLVCQEEIIGQAVKKVGRENLVISTKTGIEFKLLPYPRPVPNGQPSFVRKQCEESLSRLGVSHLDLFYLHRIDPDVPIEITMMEMKKLFNEGKIKHIGLSEASVEIIRRAHKIHPITAVQVEYSLWSRDIEDELIPALAELGIGLVAYSPLGRGFFGGLMKKPLQGGDWRSTQPRMQGEALEKNNQMLDALQQIADRKKCTTAQLALAWVEAQKFRLQGAGLVAIPGTTKEKNLISNVNSLKVQLSPDDIADIEAAVPKEEVSGDRYAGDLAAATWDKQQNRRLTDAEAEALGIEQE